MLISDFQIDDVLHFNDLPGSNAHSCDSARVRQVGVRGHTAYMDVVILGGKLLSVTQKDLDHWAKAWIITRSGVGFGPVTVGGGGGGCSSGGSGGGGGPSFTAYGGGGRSQALNFPDLRVGDVLYFLHNRLTHVWDQSTVTACGTYCILQHLDPTHNPPTRSLTQPDWDYYMRQGWTIVRSQPTAAPSSWTVPAVAMPPGAVVYIPAPAPVPTTPHCVRCKYQNYENTPPNGPAGWTCMGCRLWGEKT